MLEWLLLGNPKEPFYNGSTMSGRALLLFVSLLWITSPFVVQAEKKAFPQYIDEVSKTFIGKPFVLNPLGEGVGIDADPKLRLDAFDCTTFIETVFSLSLAIHNGKDPLRILDSIRYAKGDTSFLERNHFISADWIPNNQAKGYVTDVTKSLFPTAAQSRITTVDKKSWFLNEYKINTDIPVQKVSLPYVSAKALVEYPRYLNNIPHGAVVSFLNTVPATGNDIDVYHQGIAIWSKGKLYLRHASQKQKKIMDEPLKEYIQSSVKNRKAPVGLNIVVLKPEGKSVKR